MLAENELQLQGIAHAERASDARFRAVVKRTFDVVGGTVLLVLMLPVMAAVAIAIWLGDGGPVLYRQRRVGFDNRDFGMWKFRSMVPGADTMNERLEKINIGDGLLFKVADDPRVTRVGRVLRRFSLDELPQLLNVIAGDMSLVGPRPLPARAEDFDAVARRRHEVRPGITGPWQVARERSYSYEEMISLDLEYVERWSLSRDLVLLVLTIPAALTRGRP